MSLIVLMLIGIKRSLIMGQLASYNLCNANSNNWLAVIPYSAKCYKEASIAFRFKDKT